MHPSGAARYHVFMCICLLYAWRMRRRLHARRNELAPSVKRWQAFRTQMEAFEIRKTELLERQAGVLDAAISQLTSQAMAL